jgi:hypothetical protein
MAKTKDSKNNSTTKDEENQRRNMPKSNVDESSQKQPAKQTPDSEL